MCTKFKKIILAAGVIAALSLGGCSSTGMDKSVLTRGNSEIEDTYANLVKACDESSVLRQDISCKSLGMDYANAIDLCLSSSVNWSNVWVQHAANACDVASIAFIPNTAIGKSQIPYSEVADGFDLELRNSLKKLDRVVVNILDTHVKIGQLDTTFESISQSPRIVFWLSRVEETSGKIAMCELGTEDEILELVELPLSFYVRWLGNYVTYQPASAFNAKIIYTLPVGDDKSTGNVIKVEFVNRDLQTNEFNCES